MTDPTRRNSHPDAVGIRVLLSVGLGTFMSALDASVVNTVLPEGTALTAARGEGKIPEQRPEKTMSAKRRGQE